MDENTARNIILEEKNLGGNSLRQSRAEGFLLGLEQGRKESERMKEALEKIFREHCDNGCENIALEAIGKPIASKILSEREALNKEETGK
jgi:uncharacterized protein YutD